MNVGGDITITQGGSNSGGSYDGLLNASNFTFSGGGILDLTNTSSSGFTGNVLLAGTGSQLDLSGPLLIFDSAFVDISNEQNSDILEPVQALKFCP